MNLQGSNGDAGIENELSDTGRREGRRAEVNGESSTEAKTPPHVKQPVGICGMNQGKETHDL